jgi:hypothetical protein
MKKSLLLPLIFLSCICILHGQSSSIEWSNSLGGSNADQAFAIIQTLDGGFIAVGDTYSDDGDVTGHHGTDFNSDYWLVKLSTAGAIEWQKCYGGSEDELALSVRQTTDGGYIIAGRSSSNDGDLSGLVAHGDYDYWLVKTDVIGDVQWSQTYGGTKEDVAEDVQQTPDGGYILVGSSYSRNGDISSHIGSTSQPDVWVVKTDAAGAIIWEKSYGGNSDDVPESIGLTNDGGYLIAATTRSADHDVSSNHGLGDMWVLKLNNTGTILWENTYGGTKDDAGGNILSTTDGGYLIAGKSQSSDGEVSDNNGLGDAWVIRTDALGNLQAENNFGGSNFDNAMAIMAAPDGGYIIAGGTNSDDGDVTGFHGGGQSDVWIVKANTAIEMEWNYCYGGTGDDNCLSAVATSDGGFISAGMANSINGDVTGNHGESDFWIVKFASESVAGIFPTILQTSFCPGESFTFSYAASGGFNPGNIFSAQLSDATGSFTSPVTIGSVSSTASGNVSAIIPPLTPSGSGYKVRMVSSDPAVVGDDNGNELTVACPIPTELGTPGLTATSVDLKWQKIGCASGYQVKYRQANTTTWTTINTNSNKKTINGLTPSTKYEWKVKTQCVSEPKVTSQFSSTKKFTTDELKTEKTNTERSTFLYPNPFSGTAALDLSEFSQEEVQLEIFITDLSGKVFVKRYVSGSSQIEIGMTYQLVFICSK